MNDENMLTQGSPNDEIDEFRGRHHINIKSKPKSAYKNKCIKCMCIVFCCHDDNIEDEEDQNQEDKQEFLSSKEIIGFEGVPNPKNDNVEKYVADS